MRKMYFFLMITHLMMNISTPINDNDTLRSYRITTPDTKNPLINLLMETNRLIYQLNNAAMKTRNIFGVLNT